MFKILVKDVVDSYKYSPERLYFYFNGREIKLFKKESKEKSFKKISALSILRSLKKDQKNILNLSGDDAIKLRAFAKAIIAKKDNQSSFIQFLSRLQNMVSFKGFFTSKELAIKLLGTIKEQAPTKEQAPPPPFLDVDPKVSVYPRTSPAIPEIKPEAKIPTVPPQKSKPQLIPLDPINPYPYVARKTFIRNFATDFKQASEPSTPFMEALTYELNRKGYPFVEQDLEEIEQHAFHIYIEERVRKLFKEDKTLSIQPLMKTLLKELQVNFPKISMNFNEVSQHILTHLSDYIGSAKQRIQDYVQEFLKPYFLGQITPENELQDRPTLMQQLLDSIQTNLSFGEIQQIALDAYFLESIRGKETILNRSSKMYKPLPATSIFREMVLQALIPALAKDFPKISMSENEILNKIDLAAEQFRLTKIYDLQRLFEDFLDIQKMEMLRRKVTSAEFIFNPTNILYSIDQTQTGYDLCERDGMIYTLIFKSGNLFYRGLLSQTSEQASFDLNENMRESSYNRLFKILGMKIYRPKQDNTPTIYYFVNRQGILSELPMAKIEKMIDLIKKIDTHHPLVGAIEYGLGSTEELEMELRKILYT